MSCCSHRSNENPDSCSFKEKFHEKEQFGVRETAGVDLIFNPTFSTTVLFISPVPKLGLCCTPDD